MINGNIEIQVEIKTNMNTILETRKPKSEEMGSFFCGSNHLIWYLITTTTMLNNITWLIFCLVNVN
ncbi:hypothetical protein DERP_010054 [Dermatophagoides pteronyssinus]|uniref:Uncharacterized protein n=1 Tax=Dermatophagoides pteronyssinus TaxID=6956 RepID=A0ABQ8JES4_DERPT|nr:hypothetical protein DERP_010054 [Dermatophagoides pteronyssinus]